MLIQASPFTVLGISEFGFLDVPVDVDKSEAIFEPIRVRYSWGTKALSEGNSDIVVAVVTGLYAVCRRILLVKEKTWREKIVYLCEICGLGYLDKATAEQCEEWCGKTGTCSVEITRKAVYFPNLYGKQSA